MRNECNLVTSIYDSLVVVAFVAESMISPSHAVPTSGPLGESGCHGANGTHGVKKTCMIMYDNICMTSPKMPIFWKASISQLVSSHSVGLRFSQPWDHGSLPSSKVS